MSYESIYPEFFKTGISKLQKQSSLNGDFLGLFSALEHFRRDITSQRDVKSVLEVAELYVFGLDLFETAGFFLINPENFDFELVHCAPEDRSSQMQSLVHREMKSGRFAWALKQSTGMCFSATSEEGSVGVVFHALGVATHRLGMFCGILKQERVPRQEVTFSLLSILLGATSDALAVVRTTEELRNKILAANETLQRALRENEVLARIPAENPNPVIRFNQNGLVLFSNAAGLDVLNALGCQVGDHISGEWLEKLHFGFQEGAKREFETTCNGRIYSFLIVPFPEQHYANFYGKDITARKSAEAEQERLINELRDALAKVKTLSGLVPICAWCKKIRDDRGFWEKIEVFIQNHSEAVFSHGVCPDCMKKFWNIDKFDPRQDPSGSSAPRNGTEEASATSKPKP